MGVGIPYCDICGKLAAVLNVAEAGGPFVEVCDDCLKFGKRIEPCEVDNKINHYNRAIDVINIKKK